MSVYESKTRAWIEAFVIGLQLCPFARRPYDLDLIRFVVNESDQPSALLESLLQELHILQHQPASEIETTLLIHPNCLTDFEDYLDFLAISEELLRQQKLEGIIQIASFHPQYQFADTEVETPGNYRNRSPYPMLHLLREDSISQAVDYYPNLEHIPSINIKTMEDLGLDIIRKKLSEL